MAGRKWWCDQGVTEADVKGMLLRVAWRNARDGWRKEIHEKPKLSMIKLITECEI